MRLRSVGQASRRVRPVRRTRRPESSGRRPGRRARDHAARRGRRHGSVPYASIADDSEVDPDRPIKCCDDIHSICHYPPAPVMRGREASRDGPTIGEILTVATFAGMRRYTAMRRASDGLGAFRDADRSRLLRAGQRIAATGSRETIRSSQVGTSRRVEGKTDVVRPILCGCVRTRQTMSSRNGQNGGRRMAGPSIGHTAAADAAGEESPVWPAKRPGRTPG